MEARPVGNTTPARHRGSPSADAARSTELDYAGSISGFAVFTISGFYPLFHFRDRVFEVSLLANSLA